MATKQATTDQGDSSRNLPAIIPVGEYAMMQFDPAELQQAIEENLGGLRLGVTDLDRVTIPAGGGTAWEIPTMTEPDVSKTLDGVIVYWKSARVFWATSLDDNGGGTPPDCASDDGKCGVGNPGGDCSKCMHNEWDSGKDGHGKACKELIQVFLLREDSLLPILLALPPTSIKPFRVYMRQLLQRGLSYTGVVTRFTLEKTTQKTGSIVYSVVKATMLGMLDATDKARVRKYATDIRPMLQATPVGVADYQASGEGAAPQGVDPDADQDADDSEAVDAGK